MNLTKQIAIDYARDRIHANALCPGFTKTAQSLDNYVAPEVNAALTAQVPWGMWGEAVDVARVAVFLASEDAAYVTGVGLPVDGGFCAC